MRSACAGRLSRVSFASFARAVTSIALAALLYGPATSCRQVLGIDDRKVHACGGLDASTNACSECIAGACCGEEAACSGDPACAAAFACFLGCAPGDGTCQSACDASERFTDARAKLQACMAGFCPDACPRACAPSRLTTLGCAGCAQPCCTFSLACAGDLGCGLERSCEEACAGGRSCIDGCASAHPDGAAMRARTASCAAQSCGPAQGGPWDCVGRVNWFNSDPTPMTLTGIFRDAISGQVLPALRVRGCSAADPACAQPLATTVAGPDGISTLTFDSIAKSKFFAGYLEISGTVLGANYNVLLYVFPPPTTDSQIRWDLVSIENLKLLASAAAVDVDDTRGHVYFGFADCRFIHAADVSTTASTADAKTQRFFIVNGSPSTTATSSPNGFGGFLDLPPALTTFTTSYEPLCLKYSSLALFVRAGWVTEAVLPPSP